MDRTAAMVSARASGKTLKEIGNTHGVSVERVRQILLAESMPKHPLIEAGLSIRALNALSEYHDMMRRDLTMDHLRIALADVSGLKAIKNIGKTTIDLMRAVAV